MLCELSLWGNLFTTWFLLSSIALVSLIAMSGVIFHKYYQHPTYEQWTRKSNPKFPSAEMVRNEIVQMIKGMWTATFCPALSLHLAQRGLSKAYCGMGPNGEYGLMHQFVAFFVVWIAVDFWEFFYHRLGHTTQLGWKQHLPHHLFHNPSPFAVIADEYIDQFVRSAPLVVFPLLFPVNMDMMFVMFATFFYGYGVYLHWGYELDYPDAHHPFINTAFQHNLHHAISIRNKPYHTGFFFKIWDQLFGSMYEGPCFCAKCAREKGERSEALFAEAMKTKPDYSVMMQLSFWMPVLRGANGDLPVMLLSNGIEGIRNTQGPEVKASNFHVSGRGTILANAPLLQTRAYWDFKIVQKGEFFIGVARKGMQDLDKQLGERKNSWSFHSGLNGGDFKVGDVIGCSYDLSQVRSVLEFYLNGEKLDTATIRDVKGDVYPAVSVLSPTMLEANFGQAPWAYKPPNNFDAVIYSRDML